ncbi:2-amino-4-hydroxy-6-hydroxymethyldihydropteridine diphosphokinase [Flavobacteriaceae bacterium]|nr:2-amino-4-hydroxy-6-hydroxymethyldihydropteridine diphosphokinase [Flavobacteriaceae bacterium]
MIKRIIFVLGSNIGNRNSYLNQAIKELIKELELKDIKQSFTMHSNALLKNNSPKDWDMEFFNVAISGDINLKTFQPQKILLLIKKIEQNLGRIDRGKWAPREIDIDIAIIEGIAINEKNLQIPHAALFERDFFIKTIKDIERNLLNNLVSSFYINNGATKP